MRTRADDIAQQYRQLCRRLKTKAREGRVNGRERVHIRWQLQVLRHAGFPNRSISFGLRRRGSGIRCDISL